MGSVPINSTGWFIMNIKLITFLLVLCTFAIARDRGHSMAREIQQLKQQVDSNQKDRVPNQKDDSQDSKVYEMENQAIELDLSHEPVAGPKY